MANTLTRMERDELIERTPDPDDGRSSRVTLTRLGKRIGDRVADRRARSQRPAGSRPSPRRSARSIFASSPRSSPSSTPMVRTSASDSPKFESSPYSCPIDRFIHANLRSSTHWRTHGESRAHLRRRHRG